MAAGSKELSAPDRPKIRPEVWWTSSTGFPELKVVVNPVQAHNPARFSVLLGRLSQGLLGTR